MRIAVVGSGIAGLGAAWLLAREHQVVLFERESRLGGHTHTHEVERDGRQYRIDSGFIVFSPANYPLFSRLLRELGVESQPTTMSFSVQDAGSGLEYNAGSLAGLFCQKRNLVSPAFWRMLTDLRRFYREAPALLRPYADDEELGEYLARNRYGDAFVRQHLVPMASALWSSPSDAVMRFPARYLVQFMANHHMLQLAGRPEWRVVRGGSDSYVRALQAQWRVDVRLGCAVRSVQRTRSTIELATPDGSEHFDQIVLACHSDQALELLQSPTDDERAVLGAIGYQENEAVLHTDAAVLPRNRRAWAAWNAHVPAVEGSECTVSYCMNLLQSIDSPEPFVVTLNRSGDIDPSKVIARMRYQHPEYTPASVAAQSRRIEINGRDRIWYAGAYWGWGFHEDGLRSAVDVASGLGSVWR